MSGAKMDRIVRPSPWSVISRVGVAVLFAIVVVVGAWRAIPGGFAVERSKLEIATVRKGEFHDELIVRATAIPSISVVLDAIEGGRVEGVFVRDGALVSQGDLLYQLSNPQRVQEVLARSADVAQQVANVATLRAALATGRAEHRRRTSELKYNLDRARKEYARSLELATNSFLSPAAIEQSRDVVRQWETLLLQAEADAAIEETIRERAIAELDRSVKGLNQGLALVRASADALAVRAPNSGRLTGFRLQVGETVKPGDRLGRIDSPGRFKLTAQVDEFYLRRTFVGLQGKANIGGNLRQVTLSRVNPQIKDRQFEIELEFIDGPELDMQPGQSVETRIVLGAPASALLLPDRPFFAETGGAWAFVVTPEGQSAARRVTKLGRRSGGQIEVLAGLMEGEQVIVSSYADFENVQKLRITR